MDYAEKLEKARNNNHTDPAKSYEEITGRFNIYLNISLIVTVLTVIALCVSAYFIIDRESGDYFISAQDGQVIAIHPHKVTR